MAQKRSRQQIGRAGELFVAAELNRRGALATLANIARTDPVKTLWLLSLLCFALSGCTTVLQGFTKGFTSRPIYYPVPVRMAPVSSYPPVYPVHYGP